MPKTRNPKRTTRSLLDLLCSAAVSLQYPLNGSCIVWLPCFLSHPDHRILVNPKEEAGRCQDLVFCFFWGTPSKAVNDADSVSHPMLDLKALSVHPVNPKEFRKVGTLLDSTDADHSSRIQQDPFVGRSQNPWSPVSFGSKPGSCTAKPSQYPQTRNPEPYKPTPEP